MKQGARLATAFGISIVILVLWSMYFAPEPKPKTTVQPKKVVTDQEQTKTVKKDVPPQDKVIDNKVSEPDKMETVATVKNIAIETPVSNIVLSTKGGVFTSYELYNYHVKADKKSPHTNLLADAEGSTALFLGLKGYPRFNSDKVFEVVSDDTTDDGKRTIVLAWQNKDIRIEKTFTFDALKTDYAIKVDYQISNLSDRDIVISPYLQSSINQKEQPKKSGGILSFLKFEQPDIFHRMYYKEESLTDQMDWTDFKGGEIVRGDISWTAISDRYFIVALVPSEKESVTATIEFDRKDNFLIGELINKNTTLGAGQKIQGRFISYIGPKVLQEMETLAVSLEKSVDYGWFSVLAIPILWLMSFLHKFIPNWGLVIITLTFIVKMLLHPINKKSMQSMKGMQQLQPKMKEIKEKFKDDKQKQNQAVMQLFKTHKVNPMSGCLPMLLQLPVYIVLYKVLWNAIEIYHAPFFGPYNDLSAPDPYYIMPVLLGVFMFLQQKLTPSASADPTQQKMMMIMPVMFTVFMLFLPLGLVLYIFVNTVMSVIQQWMLKKDITFMDLIKGRFQPKQSVV